MNQLERDICARVREFRESMKWSQAHLAEVLGISRDQLASIEYARTPLRYEIAWKMRRLFGLSPEWLCIGGADLDFPNSSPTELPAPESTALSKSALLSEVSAKIHGPLPESGAWKPKHSSMRKPKRADVTHRSFLLMALKLALREWIARVPNGYTEDFYNKLNELADKYLKTAPEVSEEVWGPLFDALLWEEMRSDINHRIAHSKQGVGRLVGHNKDILDTEPEVDKMPGMISEVPTWAQLKKLVAQFTSERGQKAALADELGVSRQVLGNWLSADDQGKPDAELTLRLLKWVRDPKRKKTK